VRRRLDVEMVRRGLVETRSEAAQAIRAGKVAVGGRTMVKPSTLVASEEPVVLTEPSRRFVSRGGEKLDAALSRFSISVAGSSALDAGASTGGFTDCLLQRDASRVLAVDVGYGQLAWSLRQDPRVMVMERTNVRNLRPEDLPFLPHVVTADLSFISLRAVIPALVACSLPRARFVLLVKPQFEAGRAEIGPKGVVRDPRTWRNVLGDVAAACEGQGLVVEEMMASPVPGPAGNIEFLLYATRRDPPEGGGRSAEGHGVELLVERAVGEAMDVAMAIGTSG
jgi:23S rRNA (cytidine1920-2'-O)/16S rRNA (cytidine1409-2'-O)-methyltransferase